MLHVLHVIHQSPLLNLQCCINTHIHVLDMHNIIFRTSYGLEQHDWSHERISQHRG